MWTIDGAVNFNTYFRSSCKAMADREKRGEDENIKKLEYLENQKR